MSFKFESMGYLTVDVHMQILLLQHGHPHYTRASYISEYQNMCSKYAESINVCEKYPSLIFIFLTSHEGVFVIFTLIYIALLNLHILSSALTLCCLGATSSVNLCELSLTLTKY